MTKYGLFLEDMEGNVQSAIDVFSDVSQPKTRKTTIYHSSDSPDPKAIEEDVGPVLLGFRGLFQSDIVARERKLQYLLQTDNAIILVYFDRDIATYVSIANGAPANDPAGSQADVFSIDCISKGVLLGQVREAVDTRCTTDGTEMTDIGAMRDKAVKLDTNVEYVYFELTQNEYTLPEGNYELIVRLKASVGATADLAKLEVKNITDAAVISSTTRTLTTEYKIYTSEFTIDSADVGDTIRFTVSREITALVHIVNDSTNTVTSANASDQATVNTLLNEIKADYNAHIPSTTYHDAADTTNAVTSADASDLATSLTLANEIKADYNAHRSQAGVHPENDTGNGVTSADATDLATVITLANEIKADYNAHLSATVTSSGTIYVDFIGFVAVETDFYGTAETIAQKLNAEGYAVADAATWLDGTDYTVSEFASGVNHYALALSKAASIFEHTNLPISKAASLMDDSELDSARGNDMMGHANMLVARIASIIEHANLTASKAASILTHGALTASKGASVLAHANLSVAKAASSTIHANLAASRVEAFFLDGNMPESRRIQISHGWGQAGGKTPTLTGVWDVNPTSLTNITDNSNTTTMVAGNVKGENDATMTGYLNIDLGSVMKVKVLSAKWSWTYAASYLYGIGSCYLQRSVNGTDWSDVASCVKTGNVSSYDCQFDAMYLIDADVRYVRFKNSTYAGVSSWATGTIDYCHFLLF